MTKVKKKDVCIVIPIYKDNKTKLLEQYEIESIKNTLSLMHKYDIYFMCDVDLDISYYLKFKSNKVNFKYFNFKNEKEYSFLCLNHKFYESFNSYKYMLICQPDAWIFKDQLLYWCNKGYDYCGSLIIFRNIIEFNKHVVFNDTNINVFDYDTVAFNGGFSLRNVQAFYNVCINHSEFQLIYPEDVVISFYLKKYLKLITISDSFKFSAEYQIYSVYPKLCNQLPFGCHRKIAKQKLINIFNIKQNNKNIKYIFDIICKKLKQKMFV